MDILDIPQTTVDRIDVIQNKTILKSVYVNFYKRIKSKLKAIPKGDIIELGSGAGFIKRIMPKTITTDILNLPNVDKAKVDAEKLPFKKTSLSAIVMMNVLHHVNTPENALEEFNRVLKPGGRVVMIEPANTWFGRFMNQNFHHEEFDPTAGWKLSKKGPLSGGNGAIPWIVFERDRKKFEKKFPQLKVISIEKHTPLKYILSGGFSKPQLLPSFLLPGIDILENILKPFNNYLGMFQTIVIEKIS